MKIFSFLMVVVCSALALAFCTSCSGNAEGKADKELSKTVKIGISIPSADHGWTGGVVFWAKKAQEELSKANPDVRFLLSTSKDAADQVSGIENMLVQGISVLVVLPHEPAPLTPICRKASESGVKVVVVDRGLSEKVETLSVVGDNSGFGRVAAEQIVKAIGESGKIAIMQGVLCQVNTDRVEAFKNAVKAFPNVEIIEDGVSNWSTEQGLKLMENYIQKNRVIDAVWAGDDDVLLGALKAYEESGRSDVKIMIGGGGSKAVIKMIIDGNPIVTQTVTYPPRMIYTAAEKAVDIARGAMPENSVLVVPAEVIDISNAEENYFPESAY